VSAAATAAVAAPWIVRAQSPLALRFRTIPDPDGWAESLRLKGDWLVFEIGDGVLSVVGEAYHSQGEERCTLVGAQGVGPRWRGGAWGR
jgi:hypothetical protein